MDDLNLVFVSILGDKNLIKYYNKHTKYENIKFLCDLVSLLCDLTVKTPLKSK